LGSDDNQDISGYIQFVLDEAVSKVTLNNNSWEYLDPLDMKDFLSDDMVVKINEAGYNDRNDSLAIINVEFANETFLINRSCSGKAWRIYMDGIQGYNITNASFMTHYKN
jgi:hypothetical protein